MTSTRDDRSELPRPRGPWQWLRRWLEGGAPRANRPGAEASASLPDRLRALGVDPYFADFAERFGDDLAAVWWACPRADWMIDLAVRLGVAPAVLVAALRQALGAQVEQAPRLADDVREVRVLLERWPADPTSLPALLAEVRDLGDRLASDRVPTAADLRAEREWDERVEAAQGGVPRLIPVTPTETDEEREERRQRQAARPALFVLRPLADELRHGWIARDPDLLRRQGTFATLLRAALPFERLPALRPRRGGAPYR